ncbi:MAG: ABC transporter permease, partial [Terrimonas sp.]|nr:ABC transporter permease [Terrimonas sp.]
NFHENGRKLFQVYERNFYDGKVDAGYSTQGLLADELKRNIPEIQYTSGFEYVVAPGTLSTAEANGKIIKMLGFFADADFFNMFSFPLLRGKAQASLQSPDKIAISRKMAEQFFGSADNAISKTVLIDTKAEYTVAAVFENLPANSSFQFDFLLPWQVFVKQNKWVNNWGNTSPATYVQLKEGAAVNKVEAKIKDFIYNYTEKNKSFYTQLALQPFNQKYLYSNFKNGYIDGGRIEYVRLFTIIAIFILIIACINFMNLATARSGKRAKEIGLRKVIGAMRWSLIWQFLGEALLITLFSITAAFLIVVLMLPLFNSLTGKQLTLPIEDPVFWLSLLGLLAGTGLIAGSYPALFLSSLNPLKVLKGKLKFGWAPVFFRQGLVVFQFSLSILLIVGMIVIYRQMDYIQSKNLGYDRENLIYIPIEGSLADRYSSFKEQAQQLPGVMGISKMRNSPTVIEHHNNSIGWPGKAPDLTVSFADGVVGYDFIKTMKLSLKKGRDFSKEFGLDSANFILNETAVKKMGFENPVGQTVTWGNHPGKIIGVLKDFHFNSMHQAIEPLILRVDEDWSWGTILVRTKPRETKEAIAGLEKLCKTINPKFPFTYQFSDLEFEKLYRSEQVISKLSNIFAFLAIFISCLGLFGLAAFTAEQRTKEIGVRKVLGASVSNILTLLVSNFLKPVGIALIIAFPLAWYIMHKWLMDFQYKINMGVDIFLLAGILTFLIAIFTVAFQSIKSALANPVKNLRVE